MLGPRLLIADEPTTALDVTVQSQILDLLLAIRDESGAAILLITHDLAAVAGVCDRVIVMYAGRIVETGGVEAIFGDARHPYTRALLASLLPLGGEPPDRLDALPGQPPRPGEWAEGCRFRPRCPLFAELRQPEICAAQEPALVSRGGGAATACHFIEPARSLGRV
jgi:oligopeptide/dipeptide ABC transporter ATP-binding protein